MIIVKLMGGLGNQMFQYALGRRLSVENDQPLKLDLAWFETQQKRAFELDHFNIQADIATRREVEKFFPERKNSRLAALFRSFSAHAKSYEVCTEKEPGKFDPLAVSAAENRYLEGYWQSEKYFKPIEQVIRKDFTLKIPSEKDDAALLERICAQNSVSLHIRRGDYVSDPVIHSVHGVLSLTYYTHAMRKIGERVASPSFFVFSDDIAWARGHLRAEKITFVEHNDTAKGVHDLALMRACRHHIIANSSFSWWGAWLSDYLEKVAIAPKRWFIKRDSDKTDILPADWLVI